MWRPMTPADTAAAHALSEIIHPGYPEDCAVFAERQRLYPAGCFVLPARDGLAGYAMSHPYVKDATPALNTLLGTLPEHCDVYYFHDIAILPPARSIGAGAALISILKAQARHAGFDTICLVAVNNSAQFWARHGFVPYGDQNAPPEIETYGPNSVRMLCCCG